MCEIPYVSAHLHGAQVPTVRKALDFTGSTMLCTGIGGNAQPSEVRA